MRTPILNFFVRLLTTSLLLGTMAACTKNSSTQSEYPIEETIFINLGSEPPTLDWTLAGDSVSVKVILNIMDPLVETDLKKPELPAVPGLFSEWTHSKDHKTWTFKLKENVKWSDGAALSSQHVVDAFERLLNPKTAASAAQFVDSIQGAKEYYAGKLKDFSKVGVKAIDPITVEFKLHESLVFFEKVMTIHNVIPIRSDLIEKFGAEWTKPENLATLGPYKLKKWVHDQYVVMERNDNYHGQKPKIKYIYGRMVEDMSTARDLFLSGKLDIQDGIAVTDEKKFKGTPEFVQNPLYALFFINFNTKKAPFKNKQIRQMIVHAIDRKEILALIGGFRNLNTGFLPKGLLGDLEKGPLEYDPKKALKIFSKLDQKQQHSLQKVVLAGNNNDTHKMILENIQAQIKRNLGIEFEIQMEEWKTYLGRIKTDAPNMFRLGWITLYSDPHLIMSLFRSDSKFNYTGWSSKTYDNLVQKAATEADTSKRADMYRQAQNLLVSEAPMITIYTASSMHLVSQRVQGFVPNALDKTKIKEMSLKE